MITNVLPPFFMVHSVHIVKKLDLMRATLSLISTHRAISMSSFHTFFSVQLYIYMQTILY